ncbi:MAG: hypothetical protein GEU87_18855 [Alphaproteobacteria bacterium]|nr:hypothetical protein [Alphaproteobacteria bacterium]
MPEIDRAAMAIATHLKAKQRGQKEVAALTRATDGLSLIRQIARGRAEQANANHLSSLFGSDWDKLKNAIITNSYRTDLHFLPKDEQESGFSGLSAHSVVLFRYPLTAPIEVLDLAQNTPEDSWETACSALGKVYPIADAFRKERPVKVLSVKSEFLADLLNRYCAIYSRLGSPDFTDQSVLRISQEVDK